MLTTHIDGNPLQYKSIFNRLSMIHGNQKVFALKQALNKFTTCPKTVDELGDVWLPFAENEDISNIWHAFVDEKQEAKMRIKLNNKFNVSLRALTRQRYNIGCVYQGIFADDLDFDTQNDKLNVTFFLEGKLQPTVDIGRTKISALPTETLLAICGIICHPNLDYIASFNTKVVKSISNLNLSEWRCIHNSELGEWILQTQKNNIYKIQKFLETSSKSYETLYMASSNYNIGNNVHGNNSLKIIYKFVSAYLQDVYDMKINYENKQIIVFTKKENPGNDKSFDLFPPMMFCRAGSNKSCKYLCCKLGCYRRGITLDHPFAQWLIKNALKIKSYLPRQFQQIVDSLCNDEAEKIINTVNEFRHQITKLNIPSDHDLSSFPELATDDFWDPYSDE